MDEGFKYVTRGKKSRKARNQPESLTLSSLTERLESKRPAFINSEFWRRCKGVIESILMAYVGEFEDLPEEVSVERIICLGLGSLVEGVRRISETQLLLLLELRGLFKVPTNHLHYTDLGSGDSLRSHIYGIRYRISSIIGDYRAGLDLFRHY
jgi:hypothetical protein